MRRARVRAARRRGCSTTIDPPAGQPRVQYRPAARGLSFPPRSGARSTTAGAASAAESSWARLDRSAAGRRRWARSEFSHENSRGKSPGHWGVAKVFGKRDCHPERSEGSLLGRTGEILRYAQNDRDSALQENLLHPETVTRQPPYYLRPVGLKRPPRCLAGMAQLDLRKEKPEGFFVMQMQPERPRCSAGDGHAKPAPAADAFQGADPPSTSPRRALRHAAVHGRHAELNFRNRPLRLDVVNHLLPAAMFEIHRLARQRPTGVVGRLRGIIRETRPLGKGRHAQPRAKYGRNRALAMPRDKSRQKQRGHRAQPQSADRRPKPMLTRRRTLFFGPFPPMGENIRARLALRPIRNRFGFARGSLRPVQTRSLCQGRQRG